LEQSGPQPGAQGLILVGIRAEARIDDAPSREQIIVEFADDQDTFVRGDFGTGTGRDRLLGGQRSADLDGAP
jgi:hypothetical protein